MLDFHFQKTFKKELKLMQKQGRDMRRLYEVIEMIVFEQPLPSQYDDHPLHGKLRTSRGCHVQGDWVLVYEIDEAAQKVTFQRTGSHSDLY